MFHGTEYEFMRKAAVAVLFIAAFFAGRLAAHLTSDASPAGGAEDVSAGTDALSVPVSTEGSWGLSFQQEGEPPVANATMEELAQYDAYYASDTDEKVIYLTFDCGYENGNTPAILEALKKHGVSATFLS